MIVRAVFIVAASLVLGSLDQSHGAEVPAPQGGAQGQPVLFQRDVMPLLARLGCATSKCHGAFAGQGGMALSLFGGSPVDDYETIVKAERARRRADQFSEYQTEPGVRA